MIFNKKISLKCRMNDEGILECARRPIVVWQGGMN